MEGYVTDVDGDDTMMDSPEATVDIQLRDLPPAQALVVAEQAGEDSLSDVQRGELMRGEPIEVGRDATFHLTLGQALTALSAIGAIDISEEPPEETNE